jgi:T-complex protein 1 subunit gamma
MNKNTTREQGKEAQAANIKAAKAVSDIVRTTLGPKSMLKMLLDPMGGIVLTNDGNAILREVRLFQNTNQILHRSTSTTPLPSP